jgi:hypothetical protein
LWKSKNASFFTSYVLLNMIRNAYVSGSVFWLKNWLGNYEKPFQGTIFSSQKTTLSACVLVIFYLFLSFEIICSKYFYSVDRHKLECPDCGVPTCSSKDAKILSYLKKLFQDMYVFNFDPKPVYGSASYIYPTNKIMYKSKHWCCNRRGPYLFHIGVALICRGSVTLTTSARLLTRAGHRALSVTKLSL